MADDGDYISFVGMIVDGPCFTSEGIAGMKTRNPARPPYWWQIVQCLNCGREWYEWSANEQGWSVMDAQRHGKRNLPCQCK